MRNCIMIISRRTLMSCVISILVMSILILGNAWAGLTVYEKGDWKVGINEVTPIACYNFGEKELLGGSITSIVEYKSLNIDVGAVGDSTFLSPIGGLSTDEPGKLLQNLIDVVTNGKLKVEDKIKTGLFGGRDFNRDVWIYGIYLGVKIDL